MTHSEMQVRLTSLVHTWHNLALRGNNVLAVNDYFKRMLSALKEHERIETKSAILKMKN